MFGAAVAVQGQELKAPIPVILDTDIGDDIDDTWALAATLYTALGRRPPFRGGSRMELAKVTPDEAQLYDRFREGYEQYWRRYFDPIGVKIRVDRTISLDVHIMPLINDSAYNDLKRLSGDKPASFDVCPPRIDRWHPVLASQGCDLLAISGEECTVEDGEATHMLLGKLGKGALEFSFRAASGEENFVP